MFIVTAKCILIEGKTEEFKTIVETLIKETRKENGCISYNLYQDINNKNILTFFEEWESENSLDKHMNTKHFKEIAPKLRKLQKKDSIVNVYNNI